MKVHLIWVVVAAFAGIAAHAWSSAAETNAARVRFGTEIERCLNTPRAIKCEIVEGKCYAQVVGAAP